MEFCKVCDNLLMLHSKNDDDGNERLVNFCRCCNNEYPVITSDNTSVFQKNFGKNKKLFNDLFVSKYTKYDPTLPTINSPCPKCTRDDDVVFIRTDEEKLKYLYICRACDETWENA